MSARQTATTPEERIAAQVLEWGVGTLMLLAPLPLGSVQAAGRSLLEFGTLLLMLPWTWLVWRRPDLLPSRWIRWGLVGMVAFGCLQIVALPASLVERVSPSAVELRRTAVPGPEAVEAETNLLGAAPVSPLQATTFSVDRPATASAVRTGGALALLLLVGTALGRLERLRLPMVAVLISGAFQSFYGTLTVVTGQNRLLYTEKVFFLDMATGTYVNPNHFACWLSMAIACGAALVVRAQRRRSAGGRHWAARLFSERGSRKLLISLLVAICVVGLIASASRAGIALGLAGLVATLAVAGRKRSVAPRVAALILVTLAMAVPLAKFGTDRLVKTFGAATQLLETEGARVTVWSDSLGIVADHPLMGSGFGTFSSIYPLYRSPEVRLFYSHTHNDFLQHLVEAGVIGSVVGSLLLGGILIAVVGGLAGRKGSQAFGLAVAVTAFLLHSMVDFNFHIPANAACAALLAGLIVGSPWRTAR